MSSDLERELREIRARQIREAANAAVQAQREAEQNRRREILADAKLREISTMIPSLVRPVLTSLGRTMWGTFELSQDGLAVFHRPRPEDQGMLLEYAFKLEFSPQNFGISDDKFYRLSLWCKEASLSESEAQEVRSLESEAGINFDGGWTVGTWENRVRHGVIFLNSSTDQLALGNAAKIATIVGPYIRRLPDSHRASGRANRDGW